MKLDSRHILILLGLALALSSCVQFSAQEGMAQLYPPVFEVDATVEDLTQTKAEPAKPVPVAPTYPEVHFTVKDKDGNVVYDKLGVWDAPLKLPIGAYSIEAYSGSNTFGSPYFTGTASGTVSGGKEETPSITMALQNALLAVGLTENLAQHFTVAGENCIRISTASASIDTGKDEYVYVPSGEALSISICGTSSAGVAKTITHSLAARSAATATYLKCDMTTTNAPAITLSGTAEAWGSVGFIPVATIENVSEANKAKIKYYASSDEWATSVEGAVVDGSVKFTGLTPGATYKVRAQIGALNSNEVSITMSTSALSIKTAAAHTKTGDELDGTDFTASFSVPEKFGVTASSLQLCKSDGTPLRTVNLTGTAAEWASDGSALTSPGTWPFLPGGNYILKGTATQNGESITISDLQISVPETPDFSVAVKGKTTYDYSLTDVNNANSKVAETIYEVGYSVSGISAALLNNSNYGLSCQYVINGNNVDLTEGTITGCSWGENNLTAAVTFAGKQKSSSALTCHITGLPYKISFQKNTTPSNWSLDNCGTNKNYLVLKRGNAYAITCAYHIPKNIFCKASLTAYAYGGSVYKSYKPTVAIHASETGINSKTNAQLSGTNLLPGNASFSTIESGRIELSRDVRKICIYTSGSGSGISVGSGDMGVVCKEFSINYSDSQ